ncbi:gliding motility-associated C-terminal domain-containing protein [Flagellimonas hadalis]|uniref:Gliding motility-associated C-terminal domain-containing protein n=1 Tax=Flagellimonas hadalis TaxID=2597517 RepID=A0A5N5IY25_9FLAO|nr:gliding motility-associated C-terminal domain-containing protein [Allomuricauda hadalis]KAB5491627.1 gliding motility-associated C-terminal domain-containing protein [Allomuricauda hadalis]
MKKIGFKKLPLGQPKKIWALLGLLISTIYFGGLLANRDKTPNLNMEEELYAPSISIVKTGVARSLSGGPGCDRIEYTITVTNTSTNAEVLGGIMVDVDLLGVPPIVGPDPGSDINNDNEMDPNEVWTYTIFYTVLEDDIINGQIVSQANVIADVQGQPGVTVSDSVQSALDMTACQPAISVIKILGRANCTTAQYSFQVANEGTFQILENVVLNDPLLGGDLGGPSSGDDNNVGFLDPGEVWIYTPPVYNIQSTDIINGQVVNQATVTARSQDFPGIVVSDLSDDDSPLQNDPTVLDLTPCQGAISIVKAGTAVADIDGGMPGCNIIIYQFTVTNEGDVALDNVEVVDPLLGNTSPTLDFGDLNTNGLLDPGEIWLYSAIYNITPDDIDNGQVVNQATATANVQGFLDVIVSDLSDDDSPLQDEPTVIDLSACQAGISLIKTGQALDFSGAPGCDVIQYTFEVNNTSIFYDLDTVVLNDPFLGGVLPGPDSGDTNNNNILETYETWIYTALYNITEADITNGQVVNQATVTADVQGLPGVMVSDDSDDNSPLEDDPTIVDLSACQPGVYAIKTGQALDFSGAPGCDIIRYTIEVVNSSWIFSLDNVVVNDPLLGGDLTGPDPGEDVGDDGILAPGETWTFTVNYDITEADITNGQVLNQATVTADVQAQPGETVFDLSDNDSPLEDEPTIVDLSPCNPGVYVIKTGQALSISGGQGCDVIQYSFEVVNSSWIYTLENIVLNDPLLGGALSGPDSGDDNNDTFLDPGEIWIYNATYNITPADIINGQVINQADVIADVQGQPGETASDLSDNDSPTEDDPTVVSLAHCQNPGLGLIKEGLVIDVNADGCMESILYTFNLTNTGDVDLYGVFIEDPLFGGQIPGPVNGTDANDDGVLSVGETWTYEALYAITQQDINNTFVNNQASATGFTNVNTLVEDLSDDDSLLEDTPTQTPVPNDACTDGPQIGLIKVGILVDINGDGCVESVLYNFTVTNTGGIDLDQVSLEDPLFGGQIPGPLNGTDTNDDGILSVGETWIYETLYAITQQDINNAVINNQATVTAEPVGFNNQVFDLSDNDSLLENEMTSTVIPNDACANGGATLGLIKVGNLMDINGDGCVESVLYNFTVTNTGGIDLDQVSLEDPLFGGQIPGPLNGTDTNDDGILSVGETWIYETLYAITQQDIDNAVINNQATVTAEPVGFDNQVFDLSDNDSLLENEMTSTAIPNDACTNGGAGIGLIKEGTLINVDLDENACIDSIIYVFTVTNTGSTNLVDVSLQDPLLGNNVLGPISGSDQGEDGILSVGETWTYEVVYAITQDDIDNGVVVNQATVTAVVEGSNNQVFDLSDDDSLAQNEPTSTPVPANACTNGGASLGLIKQGVLLDTNADGCVETVRYTFTVTNNSPSASIDNIVLMDPFLGGQVTGPVIGSDDNNDGILSANETWTYEANYYLVQADIDNGNILNQAVVTGEPVGFDIQLMDLSDNDSYTENEMTETIVPSDACTDGGTPIGFEIFNGITPNGDGSNDYFRILGIENYPDNQLKIYNRWGVLVYESEQYGQGNNLFYGISEGRATFQKDKELPSGTYFYILTFTGTNPGKDSYSGYLYINRD